MATTRILIWCKIILITFIEGTINLIYGLFFLVRHPIAFNKFIGEYRKFQVDIEDNDHAYSSGYYDMNRRQRRNLGRKVR